jgi:hypothetical protein
MNSAKQVKNIRKGFFEWREKIDRGGTRETCIQTLNEAVAWCDSSLTWTKNRASSVMASWQRNWQRWFGEDAPTTLQVLFFETKAAFFTEIGAWFTVALEAAIGGFLSATFFNLNMYAAAAIGVGITFILALVAKGVLPTFFHARWSDQPRAGVRQMGKFMLYVGILEAVLLLTMFYVRGSAGGPIFEYAWWVSTTLSAITTPVLAAALFIQSSLLSWSVMHRDEHELLVALQCDLESFRDFCLHRLADKAIKNTNPAPAAPAEPAPLASESKVGQAATLMLGALALPLLLSPVKAQTQTVTNCKGRPAMQLFFDTSTSTLPAAREAAKLVIRDELAADPIQIDACKFELFTFFQDGFDVAPYFTSGLLPQLMTDAQCPPPRQEGHLGPWLKRAKENWEQEAKKVCDRLKNDASAKFKEMMTPVYQALSNPLPVKSGHCTSLFDLLYRVGISSKPIRVIIVSDGIESCHRSTKPLPVPNPNTQIVMLLIPAYTSAAGNTRAEEFRARGELILKVAPWVKVTSPRNFSFDLFGDRQPAAPQVPVKTEKTALKVSANIVAEGQR